MARVTQPSQSIDAASQGLYDKLTILDSTKGMTLFRAIEGFSGTNQNPTDGMPALNIIQSTCDGP